MSQVLHLSSRYCEVMLVKNIRVMTGSYWTLLQVKKLVDLKLTGIKFDLKLTLEFDVSIYAWMGQKKKNGVQLVSGKTDWARPAAPTWRNICH